MKTISMTIKMKLQRSIFQDHEYEIHLPFQGIRASLNEVLPILKQPLKYTTFLQTYTNQTK